MSQTGDAAISAVNALEQKEAALEVAVNKLVAQGASGEDTATLAGLTPRIQAVDDKLDALTVVVNTALPPAA